MSRFPLKIIHSTTSYLQIIRMPKSKQTQKKGSDPEASDNTDTVPKTFLYNSLSDLTDDVPNTFLYNRLSPIVQQVSIKVEPGSEGHPSPMAQQTSIKAEPGSQEPSSNSRATPQAQNGADRNWITTNPEFYVCPYCKNQPPVPTQCAHCGRIGTYG